MSGTGRPNGLPDGQGLGIAVVTAQWHGDICDRLRDRALAAAADCGAVVVVDIRVPGALELPVVAQRCAADARVAAVVALGAVVRGGTPHFEYVCDVMSHALARVALDASIPVANGVLTCDTLDQAVQRAGFPESLEDKGYDAAVAAIATAAALRDLR